MKISDHKIMGIIDNTHCPHKSHLQIAHEFLLGGCTLMQLRMKNASAAELIQTAKKILELKKVFSFTFIMNDSVDVTQSVSADGVHLGQEDEKIIEARKKLGPQALIGISTHNKDEFEKALELPIDYIAIGAIFKSQTKNAPTHPVVGLEFLKECRRKTTKPLIAIGGIETSNVQKVFEAGANAVALIRAITADDDIPKALRSFFTLIK